MGSVRDRQVNRMIGAIPIAGPMGLRRVDMPPPNVLRRVKRLALYALFGCLALIFALDALDQGSRMASVDLALVIIVVASWAIISEVSYYVRVAQERSRQEQENARLEGA